MYKIKEMKHCLTNYTKEYLENGLEKVNSQELGEIIDVIKDLSQIIYYDTIVESMNTEDTHTHTQTRIAEVHASSSEQKRNMYMKSKKLHEDKAVHMKELENYSHALCNDIMEMLEGSSNEEKLLFHQKMSGILDKIKPVE
jgi:hypothetical protein